MSLFFDYFRKTLRFPLIWEKGPLYALAKGAALALDQAREDILECRTQAMPETCDMEYLARIGASRGVRQWPNEPDKFYRERVRAAYEFFGLGGKRSGLKEILARAGADVEIWEPRDVKEILSAAGTPVLDGSWKLDGGTSLATAEAVSGLPYLFWAEFCVRINLASLQEEWLHDFIKRLVYEYKPARSVPKFVYFMNLAATVTQEVDSDAAVVMETASKPLSCRPVLDGSWKVGRDPELLKLDGTWALDGFFKLGHIFPGVAEKKIKDCQISCGGSVESGTLVYAGHKTADSMVPYFTLASRQRKVDGSWVVGSDRKLDGTWTLGPGKKLSSPRMGKYPVHKLNSTLKIGYREPISESWPEIGGGIYGSSDVNPVV